MTNSLRLSGMLLTAVLLAPLTARAQQVEDDYLSYDIPPNAEKVGPGINKGGSIYYHFFFPAGVHTRESLVSIETYFEKQLVERQFMKKGLIHGLQKTWHNDGTLRSESPYKEGVMHGTFREWNEKGQLIAQYHLVNGTGRKRLYNDEGRLMIDEPMEQSQKHGLCMERTRNLGILSLYRLKNGVLTGKAFDFYPSSQLSAVVCKTEKGALHGPYITFSESGGVSIKKWFFKDEEFTESDYVRLTAKDATLPPYFADAMVYKELVDAKVKAALEGYLKLPLVKIPLEFDSSGNPVPRP